MAKKKNTIKVNIEQLNEAMLEKSEVMEAVATSPVSNTTETIVTPNTKDIEVVPVVVNNDKVIPMFKARADTSSKKLGSAIANELYKVEQVDIRAIGIQCVNQTVKAIAIANSFLSQRERGYKIYTEISFKTVPSNREGENNTITAVYFECRKQGK